MYENDILFNWYNQESVASAGDAVEIDYEALEEAYYNALVRYNEEQESFQTRNIDNDSDLVQFATGTDIAMMTGSVVAEPTSSAQQQTMYLLDIRNILILFLSVYFLITMYSKLKNLLINYYGGKD